MIFVYNVLMLLVWFGLNILNCFSWVVIYSMYLELGDLSKIQDLARLKVKAISFLFYYEYIRHDILPHSLIFFNVDGHNEELVPKDEEGSEEN